jgi:hypothetical protein
MTNLFSLRAVVRQFLMLLLASVALVAGSLVTFGQCTSPCPVPKSQDPNATNQYAFPQGTIYIDIDVRIRGTDEERQIKAGLQSWNQQNQANGSGVYFDTATDPWSVPGQINVLHILNTTLTNPDGSVNTSTAARTVYNRVDNTTNTAYDVTIFFNTGGTLSNPADPNSGPFYNPALPGYDSIFQNETEHETGHGMGLADVDPNCQQSGQSVMNRAVANCPNDNCGSKPLNVSTCDSNAVSQVPNYQPPPVLYYQRYQKGGDQVPFYYYDTCTPYYWVWYESYDGGETWWETGQVEYAGCW